MHKIIKEVNKFVKEEVTKNVAIFDTAKEAEAFKAGVELSSAIELKVHGPLELKDGFGFVISIEDHAGLLPSGKILDYRGMHGA